MSKVSSPVSLPHGSPLVTLTHPKPSLWIIELHHGQDNRLTVELIDGGLRPALDVVEREWREGWRKAQGVKDKIGGEGAVIIVGRKDQDKFFSNGLDLEKSMMNPNFFPLTFNPLLARLINFPIPTVAAINGHCFAGGFMMALACDYRVVTDGSKRNVWLCMNEVAFGGLWPLSFATILRAKVGDHALQRKIALEGHRFTPQEAHGVGLVDEVVNGKTADVLGKAEEVAARVGVNARSGVWGLIKNDLYRDTLEAIARSNRLDANIAARSRL